MSFYSESCKLIGDLYVPEGFKAGERRPGVVLCHGYTGLRHLYLPDTARTLNRAGYVVLAFDYKGWGDSEGPKCRLDPHGRVADSQAALTFLSLCPEVDENRLGLFGWSFGCSVAVWLAAVDERAKCIVGVVGVANGRRWLKSVRTEQEWSNLIQLSEADRITRLNTGASQLADRTTILYLDPRSRNQSSESRVAQGVVVDTIPLEFVDETLLFNPEWIVDRISPRSCLFVTCENDLVVLPHESEELYRKAGDPKKLVILPGFGHYDVYGGPAFDKVLEETIAWYNQHL